MPAARTRWFAPGWTAVLALCLGTGAMAAPDAASPGLPRMVDIPAGEIVTGVCPDHPRICDPGDHVQRKVKVAAFKLSATEVTFAQWDACVKDGDCVDPVSEWAYQNRRVAPPCVPGEVCQYPFDEGWGRADRPVIHVSWNDTQKYLRWLSRKTGRTQRLPTSEEWEYAAMAGATTRFPWGARLGKNQANCDGCGSRWDNRQTAPVGSFPPNRFGLHDMVGNVNEWVSTCLPPYIPGSQKCNSYLYRGGAWTSSASKLDPRKFDSAWPDDRSFFVGFRVAE